MPMWWGDFFNKTDHLNNEEQWAYAKLMAKTWLRNCRPFPDDDADLARLLNMGIKRWLKIRPRIEPFFDLSNATWRQPHLEEVFLECAARVESLRTRGGLGGRPKSNDSNDIPKALGSANGKQPKPNLKEEDSPPNGGGQNAPSRRAVADSMIEIWKLELGGILAVPSKATADRITLANTRFADEFCHDLELWRGFCQRVRGTPFLVGDNDRHWRADFEWCLKPKHILNVKEGKYDKCTGNGRFDDSGLHDGPTEPPPEIEGFKLSMDRPH